MYCNIFKREFQWFSSYNIDFGIDFYSETHWWIRYMWSRTCQMQYRLRIYNFLCSVEKKTITSSCLKWSPKRFSHIKFFFFDLWNLELKPKFQAWAFLLKKRSFKSVSQYDIFYECTPIKWNTGISPQP